MYVTYNSYPEGYIDPRSEFNCSQLMKVLIAGDLKPSKGQLDVIKAVNNLLCDGYNIELHLAGRRSNKQYCQELDAFIRKYKI